MRPLRDATQVIDRVLIRLLGLPYLRLVRDPLLHERCEYLIARVKRADIERMRVLDVGCGSGLALLYLERLCCGRIADYVGVDLDVARLAKRYRFVTIPHEFRRTDLDENWDFGQFDLVFCAEVIEHIVDDIRLFDVLCAHVKRGGLLILTTPSKDFVLRMAKHFPGFDDVSSVQDGGHVRQGYTADELASLANRNAMELLSVDWISRFDVKDLGRYLSHKKMLDQIVFNISNPRRDYVTRFVLGGEAEELRDRYMSIAVCLRKP